MSELRLSAYREKALGILAIVFVAGLATGVLGTRAYDRHMDATKGDPLQQQASVAMDRLTHDLDLNDEQAERVQAILDHYIMFEADLLSQVRSLQQQGRKEILEVLDAEQRSKFETMVRPVSTGP
ncbi:MAG: hypothetical protein R2748_27160 [Bryobacterales bacterium]